MTTNLVRVPFHQENLPATQGPDGTVWVPVRYFCAQLGLDRRAQQRRLQNQAWATTAVMTVEPDALSHLRGHDGPADGAGGMHDGPADDDQSRAVVFMDQRTLPMWLATIQVSRVKPEAREALARYQREAAEVLARHFLDQAPPRQAASNYTPIAGSMPPGHTEATLAAEVVALLRRWHESNGPDAPLSAWRIGPMLGVHQAVIELCMLDPVARGEVFRQPTKGGNAFEYKLTPFQAREEKAQEKQVDTRRADFERSVLDALHTARMPLSARNIANIIHSNHHTVGNALLRMEKAGRVALKTDSSGGYERPLGWVPVGLTLVS